MENAVWGLRPEGLALWLACLGRIPALPLKIGEILAGLEPRQLASGTCTLPFSHLGVLSLHPDYKVLVRPIVPCISFCFFEHDPQ